MPTFLALCALIGTVLAASVFPRDAHGQWVSDGIPVCTASRNQANPGTVPDGNGGAVVFWIDGRDDRRDLYSQRITSEGGVAPGWPQNGVFLATGLGELWTPLGIPDGSGGAIIGWEDERDLSASLHNIYAQRVTEDGAIAPGWPAGGLPICTAPGDQRAPRLVSDGTGGAIITWYDRRDDPGGPDPSPDIYAQRVTPDGQIAPPWPLDGVAVCTAGDGQWHPNPASDGAGGAIISWYDGRNRNTTGADIFAQRIAPTGSIAPGWTPDGIPVSIIPGHQVVPQTISDAQGGAFLIWRDARTDSDTDIYALRITGDGLVAPGWLPDGVPLCRALDIQQSLSAAPDGLGGAVVAWEDYRNYASSASDVYAQRITADGTIPPGWPPDGVPLCTAPRFQIIPVLAPDGVGGAYVAWEDPRNGALPDVYAQHVTASGAYAPGWDPNGLAVCTAINTQFFQVIVPDGNGGAIVAWEDARSGGTNTDIFAHKLGLDGPVPVLLSLMDTEITADRVVLRWYGYGAASLGAVVERRTEVSGWVELGAPTAEGEDRLRYEDRSILPGERYAYRLSYTEGGETHFTEETWIAVPGGPELALGGLWPNPARGAPVIAFSLPDDRPATLEIVDARGRMVWTERVHLLGPGNHMLDLRGRARFQPGIYWLRLTHGAQSVTARAVMLP